MTNSRDEHPILPSTRERLQQLFADGAKAGNAGDWGRARDAFRCCVEADPRNLIYLVSLLDSLTKAGEVSANLARAEFAEARRILTLAVQREDWHAVIKAAIQVLSLDNTHVPTLLDAATASQCLGARDCELAWLRRALELNLQDPVVNERARRALDRDENDPGQGSQAPRTRQ